MDDMKLKLSEAVAARLSAAPASKEKDELIEAMSANLYRRFAVAMQGTDHNEYGDFWYPSVEAGAQGIKWIEKCVESAENGSSWVNYN